MVKLIVFLGNPGKMYGKTRHNAGWLLADQTYPTIGWQQKFHAETATAGTLRLLKPQTYMNESGISVRACCDFFQIKPEEVLVVHDDLELPFGTIRLQEGGGLQGHNGLRSIKTHLGSDGFLRLRIGIGRPPRGDIATYVLTPFTKEEEPVFPLILEKAGRFLKGDFSSLPVTDSLG
jgi:PTH1 family peptidyl-tRNA hydrolase